MVTNSKPNKTKVPSYISAVGRRKTAIARVRLYFKAGEITVNGKPVAEYFPGEANSLRYLEPLRTTSLVDKVSASIKVIGGGKVSQLEAIIHGVSRALSKADPEKHRPTLKKKGFLTRDERMRERRKVGMGGKARRKKQSPKR